VRKAVVGVIVAIALAVSLSDASIAGIAAWKIVLAAAGAVIFVATGKGSTRTGREAGSEIRRQAGRNTATDADSDR
jgi:hypothetical protein